MLAVGGQTPTFKNPPFVGPHPVWDLPSIFTLAEAAGLTWAAFPDESGYPTKFYASLSTPPGNANVHRPSAFVPMAAGGELPHVSFVWSPAGYDAHPPATSNPGYVTDGQDLVWRRAQAVVDGGGWPDTVFLLTRDDWGGYADYVPTPDVEILPDVLHPEGFQAIGGSRIPLLMFGGQVRQELDTQWHSHASIPKTVMDLLGLPAIGIPRVDSAPTLAHHVDPTTSRPTPPVPGSGVSQPPPPATPPVPPATRPWAGPTGQPMPSFVTLDGSVVPAPTDGVVRAKPPKPPSRAEHQHRSPRTRRGGGTAPRRSFAVLLDDAGLPGRGGAGFGTAIKVGAAMSPGALPAGLHLRQSQSPTFSSGGPEGSVR